MAEFTSRVARSVVNLTVQQDPAADARADRETQHVGAAPGGTLPPFPERGTVGVIVEFGLKSETLLEARAERHVGPTEIRSEKHGAGLGIERTRRSDAQPTEGNVGNRVRRLFHCSLGHDNQPMHHRVRTLLGTGRLADQSMQLRSVLRDAPDNQIRTADINPYDVLHRILPWYRAPRPSGVPHDNIPGAEAPLADRMTPETERHSPSWAASFG